MRRAGFVFFCAASFGGLVACTAVLGDFEVASSSPDVGDAGPNGADVVTGGDDATVDNYVPPIKCPANQELVNGICIVRCQMGGTECGLHGKCTNSATGFACVCDKEYTGPTCGACAVGYQGLSGDGTCKPDCFTANLTCPAKSQCSDATGTAQCACAPGYSLNGSACTWTGVIKDPGFQGAPAGAWKIEPMGNTGMSFDTNASASGMQENGYVIVTGDSMCATSGNRPNVVQVFDMPSASQSEPMALTIWSAATFPAGTYIGAFGAIGAAMGNGPRSSFFWNVNTSDVYSSQKFCLGEVDYGKGHRLDMSMYAGACPASTSLVTGHIDHVEIKPDASCPAIGKVFNGDFEAVFAGWQTSSFGGASEVVTGAGYNGTYGARLSSFNDCDQAFLTGTISVPTAATLPQAALRFRFKGPGTGQVARIRLDGSLGGGVIAGNLAGNVNGTFGQLTACLPEHLKGHVGSITLEMPQATTCSIQQPDSRVFSFDDFEIVTDMSCPTQAYFIDGDFERGGPTSPWTFYVNTQSMTTGGVKTEGVNHYGSMTAKRYCNDALASFSFSVPQFNNGQFYKVQFKYRTTETAAGADFTYSMGGSDVALASTNGAWLTKTACINYGGNGATATFRAKPKGAANCGDILTDQTLDIDDVTGSVVATCP